MPAHSSDSRSLRRCPFCGYDLRGQAIRRPEETIRCPECGQPEPPSGSKIIKRPGPIWHLVMALAFGLPLLLTVVEAADQMICHAAHAAAWAPRWLMLVNLGGGVTILAGTLWGARSAGNRETFILQGLLFLIIYIALQLWLGSGMKWWPYRT